MAASALDHGGSEVAGEHDGHPQVHHERAIDLVDRKRLHRAAGRQCGVGNEDVHLAHRLAEATNVITVGEIGDDRFRIEFSR